MPDNKDPPAKRKKVTLKAPPATVASAPVIGIQPDTALDLIRETQRQERVGAGGDRDIGFGVDTTGIPFANEFEQSEALSRGTDFERGGFADRLFDQGFGASAADRQRDARKSEGERRASRIPGAKRTLNGRAPVAAPTLPRFANSRTDLAPAGRSLIPTVQNAGEFVPPPVFADNAAQSAILEQRAKRRLLRRKRIQSFQDEEFARS